jgi:hypothetical protein
MLKVLVGSIMTTRHAISAEERCFTESLYYPLSAGCSWKSPGKSDFYNDRFLAAVILEIEKQYTFESFGHLLRHVHLTKRLKSNHACQLWKGYREDIIEDFDAKLQRSLQFSLPILLTSFWKKVWWKEWYHLYKATKKLQYLF